MYCDDVIIIDWFGLVKGLVVVVGNFLYNVGTRIYFYLLLKYCVFFCRMVLMF